MKGYSINVGVSDVEIDHYGNTHQLYGAKNDVINMKKLLLATGLFEEDNILSLVDENSTSNDFFEAIETIVTRTEEGEDEAYVVCSFSGHGASYLFPGQHEESEYLCFKDKMVLEHELVNALHLFGNHVKIFVIIDACNSNGIVFHTHAKFMPERRTEDVRIKALTNREIESAFSLNNNFETYIRHLHTIEHRHPPYNADICFLAACSKNHVTYDSISTENSSFFTEVLLAKWEEGLFNGNYTDLFEKIVDTITHKDGPRISGANTEYFRKHKPFNFNLKQNVMSWTIEIHHNTQPISCTVTHPNHAYQRGSIRVVTDLNDSDLQNWNPPKGHVNGEEIHILYHDQSTGNPTTETTFNLKKKNDSTGQFITVVPFDNIPGERKVKGTGERSGNKVKDDMGGGSH